MLLATNAAQAQTYTVQSITAPAFGTLVAATTGSTSFANNGAVSVSSGSGVVYSGPVTRGRVTILCVDGSGTPRRCSNTGNKALITVAGNGTVGGRAAAITSFSAVGDTGIIGTGTTTGSSLSFQLSGWTASNQTKTFFLDVTMPIKGDDVGGTTGAASSDFAVKADKDPTVPTTGLTSSATATVRRSLQVNKILGTELKFGTLVRPTSGSGTVTIAPGGGRSVGGSNPPVELPGAAFGPANYTILGEPGTAYTISFSACTLYHGGDSLNVTLAGSFSGSQLMDASGSKPLGVGGTMTIASNTPSGLYSGSFSVSVVYN